MLSSGRLRSARRIVPEILDDTPPGEAARSLADIIRINRYFGGHAVLLRTLGRLFRPHEPFTILDVGAGTGDMGKVVRSNYPNASVTSLDYRMSHLIHAARPRVVGDAFRLPLRPKSFDVAHCSLFLHHFRNRQVIELLAAFAAVARRFVIVTDLERHIVPYYTLPATRWLFRWDRITLHDGPISVAAAFSERELRHLAVVAGLTDVVVRRYRPAFRIALVARPPDSGML